MALLPIRLFGDPILRERAVEVETFDEALRTLAEDMVETMRAAAGAGLAATQVGVLKRLFTWELAAETGRTSGAWVNPEVLEKSEDSQDSEEGCLSFPGLFYPVERPLRVRLRASDLFGDAREFVGEGHYARILLHEIDHLDGILFIDHLARHDRKAAMRRIRDGELERNAAGQGSEVAPPAGRL